MHDVPGRIDLVIVVAAVSQRRAGLRCKTGYKRRSEQTAHLFLLPKATLGYGRSSNGLSSLARQFAAEAEIRVHHHSGCRV
jgi:hypothetical protein